MDEGRVEVACTRDCGLSRVGSHCTKVSKLTSLHICFVGLLSVTFSLFNLFDHFFCLQLILFFQLCYMLNFVLQVFKAKTGNEWSDYDKWPLIFSLLTLLIFIFPFN